MRGPIDYVILGFEGNNFEGKILSELEDAIDKQVINVLAFALVAKDEEGNVIKIAADQNQVVMEFAEKHSLDDSMISQEDIEEVGDLLDDNTAAGFLVFEHLWAKGLKSAIADAGGFLIADGRIHSEAAGELEDN